MEQKREKINSCCFTEHRIISTDKITALTVILEQEIEKLISKEVKYFYCGGALGFDTLAAKTILKLKNKYDVQLIIVVPHSRQDKYFTKEQKEEYKQILALSNEVFCLFDHYYNGCMQVKYYTKKLMFIGILSTLFIMPLILSVICILHRLYSVSNEVWRLAMILTMITYPSMILFYVPSFTLVNILRATGDVKFVMTISTLSMWIFQFGGSCILAKYFGLGVIGIKIAMAIDWAFRSIMFLTRYKSGKWQKSKVQSIKAT